MQTWAQKLTAPFYAMNTIHILVHLSNQKMNISLFFFYKISFFKKNQHIIEQ